MMICQLPASANGGPRGRRFAVFGSCRVNNPMLLAAKAGEVRILASLNAISHTIAAALQLWSFATGEVSIPAEHQALVFGPEAKLQRRQLRRAMSDLDAVLIEVCDERQLCCGRTLAQTVRFGDVVVRPAGKSLLLWFREVSRDGRASPEATAEACGTLAASGAARQAAVPLIEATQMKVYDLEDVRAQIGEIRRRFAGPVILVSHFADPDDTGDMMVMRRRVAAQLRAAAGEQPGVSLLDPSEHFARLDRKAIFAGDGVDTQHLAEEFEALHARVLLREAAAPGSFPASADLASAPSVPERRRALEEAHGVMREVLAQRLEDLGTEASGLDETYARALQQGHLFTPAALSAHDFILEAVPPETSIEMIGASIGELPAALAASGRQVTAFIPGRRRLEAARAVAAQLEDASVLEPGRLQLRKGPLPDGKPRPGTLLVAIDAAADTRLPEERIDATHLDLAGRYRSILIETRLFGRLRDGDTEQERLLRSLRDLGFEEGPLAGEGLDFMVRHGRIAKLWSRLAKTFG